MSAETDPRAQPILYRIAALAARAAEPHAALREVLELFVATFQADAGSIALVSPDTGHLVVEVQTGAPSGGESYHELKPGHGITGWAALNRRSLLVPDVKTEPRYIAVRPSARCEM